MGEHSRQSGPGKSLKTYGACVAALGLVATIAFYLVFQKNVVLEVERKTTHHRTRAQSVGDFLRAKHVNLKKEDAVRPSLGTEVKAGQVIEIRRAKPIIIEINEEKIRFVTTAQTVGEALRKLGIALNTKDKVIPKKKTPLVKNSRIRVDKKSQRFEVVRTEVPFQTVEEKDASLPVGTQEVIAPGKNGLILSVFEVLALPNGEKKELSWERVVGEPQNQVVKLGTKPAPRRSTQIASRSAVSPARPAGYQAPPPSRGSGRLITMRATAYAPGYGAGTITATGRRAGYGLVAVDPRFIPLGTRLYIEGYGHALAADTGGAIKGNRIDLGYNSGAEAFAFGRRPVNVEILP